MSDYVTPRRRAELKSYVRPGCHSVWSDDEVAKLIKQIEGQEAEGAALRKAAQDVIDAGVDCVSEQERLEDALAATSLGIEFIERLERAEAVVRAAERRLFMLADDHDMECRCCDCELRLALDARRHAISQLAELQKAT